MAGGYRDEKETLRRRAADLEVQLAEARRELAALEPLRAEKSALTERVAELAREVELRAGDRPPPRRQWPLWVLFLGAAIGFAFGIAITFIPDERVALMTGIGGAAFSVVLANLFRPTSEAPPVPDPEERIADARRRRAREKKKRKHRARVRVDTQREHVAVEAKANRARRRR